MNLIILIPAVIAAVLLSASTDTKALYDIMKTGFPRRTFSIIVIVLGAAFISLAISKLVMHYSGIETASAADTAVNISDITSSLIWIITGFLVLFRNRFRFCPYNSRIFSVCAAVSRPDNFSSAEADTQ